VINMRQLELSEAQLKNLLVLLDKELRSSGLEESASEEVVPSSK
jgi:hypothetical protein